MSNFVLTLLKPSKSDIFSEDYFESKVAFGSVSIYIHVGWYRTVFKGRCLQLNCFPLASLIFYINIFNSLPNI